MLNLFQRYMLRSSVILKQIQDDKAEMFCIKFLRAFMSSCELINHRFAA